MVSAKATMGAPEVSAGTNRTVASPARLWLMQVIDFAPT
ncbi:hypothetical protein MesloDRAFT_0161 [Mesorhizobium japonicum R7A]|nr:hypothetical protein MesloDRAFT_0161 [Mesorhizobium japonicum R7A]